MSQPQPRLAASRADEYRSMTLAESLSTTSAVEPGADCLPCKLAQEQGVGQFAPVAPDDPGTSSLAISGEAPPAVEGLASTWSGVIGVEGAMTGDGRLIEPDALRWAEMPLPLRYVAEDVGAHDGAVVVGSITEVTRGEGGKIMASGTFDLDSPLGQEASRVVTKNLLNGVSMDLDDVTFEVRVAKEIIDEMNEQIAAMLSEDGAIEVEEPQADSDGRVTVATVKADDEVRVTTDARVRAATLVSIPAFAEAQIFADDTVPAPAPPTDSTEPAPTLALTASAPPVAPPAAWFENPRLDGPTPLRVESDGRIYGHLARWGTCHTSHTARGQCISPPHSESGYRGFHLGYVVTAEGAEVATGRITMGTKHAPLTMSASAATTHYDDTGSVVADVVAGEDVHGIWVAGALRPDVTPAQVRALRGSPLSGDWRQEGLGSELVAVLAVNVAGFPVPRPQGRVEGGVVRALVASGMLPPTKVRPPGTEGALSLDDLRYLKRLAARERAEEAEAVVLGTRASALAARVRSTQREAKVRAFARERAAARAAEPVPPRLSLRYRPRAAAPAPTTEKEN